LTEKKLHSTMYAAGCYYSSRKASTMKKFGVGCLWALTYSRQE